MDAQLRKSLSDFSDPSCPRLRAIVLDYLCHNSYTNTARVFSRDSAVKNVDADGDEIMSSNTDEMILSEEMLQQVEIRKDIRRKILCGHVDEAVELLNTHFPAVLSESDDPVAIHNFSSPNEVYFVATTSVEPAHLSLNLRILAFIEACRTVPLASTSSYTTTDISFSEETKLEAYDPDDPVAYGRHLDGLLTRVRKLYTFVHTLHKPTDRSTYLEELGQVSGLLAYKTPEKSPMAKYLSLARREAVADQINSAVLYRTGLPAISKLELNARYTTTLWGWMHDMKYELPPQRTWPPGIQPISSGMNIGIKDSREVIPAFNLSEFLDTKSD